MHPGLTTFGLKLAVWYDEMRRNRERMRRAAETVRVGKISGAVGTFAHLDPDIEEKIGARRGLMPAPASIQTLPRDRHAEYLSTLAIIGASLERRGRSRCRPSTLVASVPLGHSAGDLNSGFR